MRPSGSAGRYGFTEMVSRAAVQIRPDELTVRRGDVLAVLLPGAVISSRCGAMAVATEGPKWG